MNKGKEEIRKGNPRIAYLEKAEGEK